MKIRFVLLALVFASVPARGQAVAAPDTSGIAAPDTAMVAHVAVQSAIDEPLAVHRAIPAANGYATADTHKGMGQSKALMGVGIAGFVAGALIGGDAGRLIMVGSAVVGLYGLYQYLQ